MKGKVKDKKLLETEELSFLLQSGILLCKLAVVVVPSADIEIGSLQVSRACSSSQLCTLCPSTGWYPGHQEKEYFSVPRGSC